MNTLIPLVEIANLPAGRVMDRLVAVAIGYEMDLDDPEFGHLPGQPGERVPRFSTGAWATGVLAQWFIGQGGTVEPGIEPAELCRRVLAFQAERSGAS